MAKQSKSSRQPQERREASRPLADAKILDMQDKTEIISGEAVQRDEIDLAGEIMDERDMMLYREGSLLEADRYNEDEDYPAGAITTGGLGDDIALPLPDAMQGNVVSGAQGGSGGTGGDLTGERTPGGMSEDLTSGVLQIGQAEGELSNEAAPGGDSEDLLVGDLRSVGRYGGPTGGETRTDVFDVPDVALGSPVKGYHAYSSEKSDAELAKKVARENMIRDLRQKRSD